MAEYDVVLQREVTEEGYVMVEAESSAEAMIMAEKLPSSDIHWDRVDTEKHWAKEAERWAPELPKKFKQTEIEDIDLAKVLG